MQQTRFSHDTMAAFHFSWTFIILTGVVVSAWPAVWPISSAFSTHFPSHSIYRIPAKVQNGTAHARFEIDTPGGVLGVPSRQNLDAPQLDVINSSTFDWWYFDAVAEDDPRESLVVTFFTATAAAFPFLDPQEESVLIAYAWASFANGSTWAAYLPATLAKIDIGKDELGDENWSSGVWEKTGFQWAALNEDLSVYEVSIDSPDLSVQGKLGLVSVGLSFSQFTLVSLLCLLLLTYLRESPLIYLAVYNPTPHLCRLLLMSAG